MQQTQEPTPKQQRFVEEYLIDLNATQAAIRAGYSQKSAHSIGSRLLNTPHVQSLIQEGKRKRSQRTQVSQDMVLKELARIAFADLKDVARWGPDFVEVKISDELPAQITAAVAELVKTKDGVKLKLHNKNKALELVAKHLGMFDETPDEHNPGFKLTIVKADPIGPVAEEQQE